MISRSASAPRLQIAAPDVPELTIGQTPADPFVEPLSLLVSEVSGITDQIQEIQRSHLKRMESAAAQLRDQITADLKNQHRAEFQSGIQVLREEFEARLRLATAQWEAERQSLSNEIEDLRRHSNSSKLAQEVEQTEAALEALQKKIQAMLDDPTVELSRVMQENARQQQLQAYLNGLKFNV